MAKDWDILDAESTEAYLVFTKYLTMPNRSGEQVAIDTDTSLATVKNWRKIHRWRERARAYDVEMSKELMQAQQQLTMQNQDTVIMDTLTDYNSMLVLWRQVLHDLETPTVNSLMTLVATRKRIDDIGRRAVQLPNVYSQPEQTNPALPPTRRLNWANPIEKLSDGGEYGNDSSEETE